MTAAASNPANDQLLTQLLCPLGVRLGVGIAALCGVVRYRIYMVVLIYVRFSVILS